MKIAFVEPANRYVGWSTGIFKQLFMLGPVYLGTLLKQAGHEVEIYKEALKAPKLEKLDCDVLGLTTLTSGAPRAYELARQFRLANPEGEVLMGGVHATALPHEALRHADTVLVGEAENAILDVVGPTNGDGHLARHGLIQGTPCCLDALPMPDFGLVRGLKKIVYLPISTSRGCPFGCRFCSVTAMFGRGYRFRSTKLVIEELQRTKSKKIFFYDDNFCAHKARTAELMHKMVDAGVSRPWTAQTRVDVANNEPLLTAMVRAGCERLFLGFESISEKTLKLYRKGQSLLDIKRAIRALKDRGIKIMAGFVLGSDEDDRNTFDATVEFCQEMEIDQPQLSVLTPFPGCEIYEEFKTEGRLLSQDWSLYDGMHVVFKPKKLSAAELQARYVDALKELWWSGRRRLFMLFGLGMSFLGSISIASSILRWYREKQRYIEKLRELEKRSMQKLKHSTQRLVASAKGI